jgi:ABC-type thiamin/hydroxymethylpyrimidine transport system permease subunit
VTIHRVGATPARTAAAAVLVAVVAVAVSVAVPSPAGATSLVKGTATGIGWAVTTGT